MFGPLGFPEIVLILILALLIFGPKKLPEIGRTVGRGMAEFRKASNDLKRTINAEMAEMEDLRDVDPRRVLGDDPPRRPAPKKSPSSQPQPYSETNPQSGQVARGEAEEATPAAQAPTAEPAPAVEATPTTTETP